MHSSRDSEIHVRGSSIGPLVLILSGHWYSELKCGLESRVCLTQLCEALVLDSQCDGIYLFSLSYVHG